MRTKVVVGFLILLTMALAVSAAPPVEGRGRRWHKDYVLIVLAGTDATLRESVAARVAELGGDAALYFNPGILVGHLPTAQVETLSQMPGVRLVTKGTVEHPEAMGLDARALMAVRYFNWAVSGEADDEADRAPALELHGDLGMETPVQLPRNPRIVPDALQKNDDPVPDNSSRRTTMSGTLVTLLPMETAGHTWTIAQQQKVLSGVADAMAWWSARLLAHFGASRPSVSPAFSVELPPPPHDHPDQELRALATTGEAAAARSTGEVDNIVTTTLMSACDLYHHNAPCPWASKSGYAAVEAFNDDVKGIRGAANAVTVFITNNDDPNLPKFFPIGERTDAGAYAVFIGGPYWIGMTSLDTNLPRVAAHETAHLFWAEDEYPERCSACTYPIASYPGYTPPNAGTSLNGNCQAADATCVIAAHKHDCIMYTLGGYTEATEYNKVCEFTRMQINWTKFGCYNDVNWDGAGGTDTHWRGAYYSDFLNPRFPIVHWREAPDLVRDDGNGDGFDITLPITGACFTATQYTSARWKRKVNFAGGSYRFHVDAQDGFNFYVDGGTTPVLSRQTYSGEVTTDPMVLSPGMHDVVLEVYSAAAGKAHLSWDHLSTCSVPITAQLLPQADAISPACAGKTVKVLVSATGGVAPYHLTFRRDDNARIDVTTAVDENTHLPYVTLPTGSVPAGILGATTYTLLNFYDANSCPGEIGTVISPLTSPNPHFSFGKNLRLTQTSDCALQISWQDAEPVDCSETGLVFNVVNENTGKVLASCLGPETKSVTVHDLNANDFRRYAVFVEDHVKVDDGPYKCLSGQTGKLEYAFVPNCTTGGLSMTASASAAGYGAPLTLRSSLTGDGAPLANRTITFDVSGTNVGSAVTDANGVATLTTTATLPAANYPDALTAHFPGDGTYGSTSVTGNIYIPKGTPAITWPTPADIVYGTPLGTDQLNATSSTTGTFTYYPPLGTLLESGDGQPLQVSFVPSDVTNYNYTSATVYINVHKAPQTITWTAPASVGYGAALSATQLNATISVPGPDPAADLVYDPTFGTVLPVGNYTLTVNADETPNYLPATKSVPFSVVSCMPTITAQPQDALLNNGVPVVLSVTATNAGSYEWFEGTPSQFSRPFAFTSSVSVTPTTDTTYWVRVHGVCNMWVDSRVASVRVCILPTGWAVPTFASLSSGQAANLSVHIQAGTDTVIHWYTGASGDTSAPLSNTTANISVSPTVTTQYWARVSNTCGSFDTVAITVDVCSPPLFTTQPASTTIRSGLTATLTAAATVTPGTTFDQWFNGATGDTSNPVGANALTYTTPALTADQQYWLRITRGICSSDSATATVTVCDLNAWVSDMPSRSGQWVTLNAGVSGAREGATMSYSWYRGNAGDTTNPVTSGSPSLTVNPTASTHYWARVSDGTCTVDTNTATVNVCIPTITTQPASAVINSGASTTLSVVTTGENLTYQWYISGGGTVGTNSPTLTVAPTATTSYYVRVTGCGYVDSSVATLTVCQAPSVTTSYTSYQVVYGQNAAMSVQVSGTPAPSLQWYQGTSGNTSTPLNGQTGSSLTIMPLSTTSYWCKASNACATANGPTITVDVCTQPVVNSGPNNATVAYNGTATLSVNVSTSPGTVVYQWYRGAAGDMSTPVGSNSSSYTTPAQTADTQYWVRVTRGACGINSSAATVTVCTLAASVANVQAKVGQWATLTAGVSNARDTVTYAWYRGNAGDTTNFVGDQYQLQVNQTTSTNYWVRVSDGTCTVDSNTAMVSTCIPNILTNPQSVLINSGQSTTLSVSATGDSLAYQWYVGAVGVTTTPIGTNSPSLTVTPASTTTYWVRVTGCQVASSTAATVTICAPPAISTQPASPNVTRNSSTTLSVAATGTSLSYQWYLGTSGTTTSPVGTNSSSYTATYTQTTNVWVKVTGACSTVNSSTAVVSVYPTIGAQPADTSITSGTSATFSVYTDAIGATYQWYRGASSDTSNPISGATSASYTTPPLTAATSYWVKITSGNAYVYSNAGTASICPGPTVTVSNPYQTSGYGVTLSIDAPTGNDTYKWYKGNSGDTSQLVADSGSASSIVVYPTQTTSYWARSTNAQCSGNSAAVSVWVCYPAISAQPQNAGITSGQTAHLSVTANGTPALTYQWYSGAPASPVLISGATGSSVDVSPSSTTTYYVRVNSAAGCGVNSSVVTVSVCQLPSVTSISGGYPTNYGYTTSLSVTASGTNLSYQWYLGSAGDTSHPVFTNTASPSFTATGTAYYWVRVTNGCGSVNSTAVLNSVYPTIYGPYGVSIPSGTHTTLSVSASGTYLSYQWYLNDTSHPIAGATSSSYTTPNLTTDTNYWVVVTSGTAQRAGYATVSMCVGPLIDYPWSQWLGGNNYNVAVQVNEQDAGNVTYAWYKGQSGDTSQPQGNGNYYMYVSPTVQTSYWCRVSFADGSCYTDSPTITVH